MDHAVRCSTLPVALPAALASLVAPCQVAGSPPLPPSDALHLQHSPFSAPYCTWRPVAPDALPPLHDVLVRDGLCSMIDGLVALVGCFAIE
jgi:hypothetical protein